MAAVPIYDRAIDKPDTGMAGLCALGVPDFFFQTMMMKMNRHCACFFYGECVNG